MGFLPPRNASWSPVNDAAVPSKTRAFQTSPACQFAAGASGLAAVGHLSGFLTKATVPPGDVPIRQELRDHPPVTRRRPATAGRQPSPVKQLMLLQSFRRKARVNAVGEFRAVGRSRPPCGMPMMREGRQLVEAHPSASSRSVPAQAAIAALHARRPQQRTDWSCRRRALRRWCR